MSSNWRKGYPVLVVEAQTLGAVAVIRSLGRAGYTVYSCAPSEDALGFKSNYSFAYSLSPDYRSQSFIDWLRGYVRKNKIRAIIPSEAFLLAIRPYFQEFSPLLPYSSSEQVVYSGMSKADQVLRLTEGRFAKQTSSHMPPFLLLQDSSIPISRQTLQRLGVPIYVKLDGTYAKARQPSRVFKANSLDDAESQLALAASCYSKLLVEGHVPGRGVGVFFLLWQSEIKAEFMHIRMHEVPHTGGVSSYRKSWHHERVRADALEKLRALDWQGVAMMEYRWDEARDEFYFMEMNGRFWGSLHLALRAGVDFPTDLLDLFHGREPTPQVKPAKDVSCRHTFPSDLMFVRSVWKDPSSRVLAKVQSLLEFFALALNPSVGSDLWYAGDTKLYWIELFRFLRNICNRILKQGRTS